MVFNATFNNTDFSYIATVSFIISGMTKQHKPKGTVMIVS
jgi:hypothetical protein